MLVALKRVNERQHEELGIKQQEHNKKELENVDFVVVIKTIAVIERIIYLVEIVNILIVNRVILVVLFGLVNEKMEEEQIKIII